ncbi:MAG: 50S ribosomal protein L10 [Clostridia bacterium]|nr:50S ribosomal protein L10 [Clostridia bacterium]
MASETILKQKQEEVSKLAAKMKEAKLILLTNYRGITVDADTQLRRDLRAAKAEYKIIKNNITKRALAECGIEGLEDKLEGPTAVIICDEDYLEPSKAIYKFTKDNDFYQIKGGVVDGEVKTAEEIVTLAKLPSRETLLSMLAGGLLANVSKFAVALEQVRLQKEAGVEPEAKAEPEVEEKTAEEAKTEEPTEEKVAEESATEEKAEESAE